MTQEDAMKMNNEQAIQILKPFRDMMFDQHGCPISDAVFALDKAIEALSAEKTGKWIYCEDEAEEYVDGYRCDQCGYFVPWDYKHKSPYFIEEYHYCPSCKARMKGDTTE